MAPEQQNQGTHFDALYPGRFLKGVSLKGQKTIRIVEIFIDKLETDDNKKEPKAILRYKDKEGDGEIVWCKTNSQLAAQIFGTPVIEQWAGKLITIAFDPDVRFGAEKKGGIRVVGSPDMTGPMTVEIKRPRRKKLEVHHLQPTGPKKVPLPISHPDAAPPSAHD